MMHPERILAAMNQASIGAYTRYWDRQVSLARFSMILGLAIILANLAWWDNEIMNNVGSMMGWAGILLHGPALMGRNQTRLYPPTVSWSHDTRKRESDT